MALCSDIKIAIPDLYIGNKKNLQYHDDTPRGSGDNTPKGGRNRTAFFITSPQLNQPKTTKSEKLVIETNGVKL